jgi:hypothetical protein
MNITIATVMHIIAVTVTAAPQKLLNMTTTAIDIFAVSAVVSKRIA